MMIRNFGGISKTFVSIHGKIWVKDTPYPIWLEEKLRSDESIAIKYSEVDYERKFTDGKKVRLCCITFASSFNDDKALDALRTISEVLSKTFPNAEEIVLQPREPLIQKTVNGVTTTAKLTYSLIDNRINRPNFYFINKDIYQKYKPKYSLFHRSKTKIRSHIKNNQNIVFGDYFLMNYINSRLVVLNLQELLGDDPIETYRFLSTDTHNPFLPKTTTNIKTRANTKIISEENVILRSPNEIPNNAFLIDGTPRYIQFTKSGVILSNGIFFSDERLEEVKKEWYIVQKVNGGWDIYLAANSEVDGFYRIRGNLLIKDTEHIGKPSEHVIFIDNGDNKIEVSDDKIVIHYTWASNAIISKDSIFTREKVSYRGKTLYVPRKIIENCFL